MDAQVKNIYKRLTEREYRNLRVNDIYDFSEEFSQTKMPYAYRVVTRLERFVELENVILYEGDRFGFYRTIKEIPSVLTKQEMNEISKNHFLFEEGTVGNISSDYELTLSTGFDAKLANIENKLLSETNEEKIIELNAMKRSILACYRLCARYQQKAKEMNCSMLYEGLSNVPYKAPRNYYEALLFLRIINFTLWLNANKHLTIGRFDQYCYPYYKHDIDSGIITREEAFSLTSEFFLSLNFDADLYPGIQQGDNGQSLVIGGCDENGNDAYNDLSKLVLEVSLDLNVIDPKINMRVNKNTADYWYELGTQLTKQGLGFPQYSNDDVVIPALVNMGYSLKDARNYVMAACWEFIIPGLGMDVPNIEALDYAKVVSETVNNELLECNSFENLLVRVKQNIGKDVLTMFNKVNHLYLLPSPFQSIVMTNCIDEAKDIGYGSKYNNYGFHGVGISNGTDALAAIKKAVFEDKTIEKDQLLVALKNDFNGYQDIQHILINAPKMGANDDYADNIAKELMETFSNECSKYKNDRGGIIRPGTGSALFYALFGIRLGATADGRHAGDYLACNYSPSLNIHLPGVLSVIQSFCKPDLTKTCNGGPLTLEFHSTVFRNEEGCSKVARLVRTFICLGGHQIQLNAINRDVLLDAQAHPENHKDLIVRVWGWSGYFNELDKIYQDHVIKRAEFTR